MQAGPAEASFEYRGKDPLPEWLKDGENYHLLEWGSEGIGERYFAGIIINPHDHELIKKLSEIKGMVIEQNNNYQPIHHLPERAYLYEYEKTPCKCQECKEIVFHTEILTEEIFEFDLGDKCPLCGAINSFEDLKYENINDYIKEHGS